MHDAECEIEWAWEWNWAPGNHQKTTLIYMIIWLRSAANSRKYNYARTFLSWASGAAQHKKKTRPFIWIFTECAPHSIIKKRWCIGIDAYAKIIKQSKKQIKSIPGSDSSSPSSIRTRRFMNFKGPLCHIQQQWTECVNLHISHFMHIKEIH